MPQWSQSALAAMARVNEFRCRTWSVSLLILRTWQAIDDTLKKCKK